MSRLQVGGLDLYIPTGVVCTLNRFIGHHVYKNGAVSEGTWEIILKEKAPDYFTGKLISIGLTDEKYLMPLGDKQTQDEFKREMETTQ